jgi:hypothetical protein
MNNSTVTMAAKRIITAPPYTLSQATTKANIRPMVTSPNKIMAGIQMVRSKAQLLMPKAGRECLLTSKGYAEAMILMYLAE